VDVLDRIAIMPADQQNNGRRVDRVVTRAVKLEQR
jgi:hypothetical protein